MSAREAILQRISSVSSGQLAKPYVNSQLPPADLWLGFQSRLEALGGHYGLVEDFPTLVKGPAFVDPELRDHPALVNLERIDDLWSAETSLTTAVLAVAETGSILLEAGPNRHRLASLTAPRHVALVTKIVATLDEALDRMNRNRTGVLITGPSRTADISGILVRGIHGPKELVVVRMG